MKYSVWVIPQEPILQQLQSVIDDLSKKYGGPSFEPHLTLLSGIDEGLSSIKEKLNNITVDYSELQLETENISFSTTYFQSVLLRVKPTAELMDLNLQLKKTFNMQNDLFMPHISLLYGDYSMKERESIVRKLSPINLDFSADKLIITASAPNPEDWTHDLVIPFND